MNELIIIAAVANNGVIGNNGKIPWYLKEDFKRFKELTMGHPVIMGDVTYETLPEKSRPLPGRENIVLSLNVEYKPSGNVKLFNDFNKAIEYVKNSNNEKSYIIGGATIYKLGLDVANVLEITRIHNDFLGDVRFPQINIAEWKLIWLKDHEGINHINSEIVRFTYEKYIRI